MRRSKRLPKILSAEEQARLLGQFNTRWATPHRNLCLVRLMLEAGLRVGEAVALRPEHLDMTTCRLQVREGKGAKDRVLWISDGLRDLIGSWLARRPESALLFPTKDGGRVPTCYMRQMVKRVARRAGITEVERFSPHALRHTFATDLYAETTNIRLVQKALGHSDLSTTMLYTHVVDGELEAALRRAG